MNNSIDGELYNDIYQAIQRYNIEKHGYSNIRQTRKKAKKLYRFVKYNEELA